MTISTTTNRISFVGNGSTTGFATGFKFFANSDLTVTLVTDSTAAEVTQVITTNYTVADAGVATGGTVTMNAAPAVGETLVIVREQPYTQGTDLVENDPFPSQTVEDTLDKLAIMAQQNNDAKTRSVKLSEGFTGTFDTTLPTSFPADTALVIDSAGTGFDTGPTITDIANAGPNATAAAVSATAAAASATAAAASAAAVAQELGTTDSPQFTGVNVGAATDTTITRVSAGVIAVEGDTVPMLATAQTFTAAQSGSITALTSTAASIAVDAALNNHFSHTLTENTTLANPTNLVAGTSGSFFLTQHASSPKTMAFGSYYKFAGGTAPTITAVNSAEDRIDYIVRTTTSIECVWTGAIA